MRETALSKIIISFPRRDIEIIGGVFSRFLAVPASRLPDTNVTKYWFWIEKMKIKEKIILIHVFGSEFYNNNYRSRVEL